MYKNENYSKGSKTNHHIHLLQQTKAQYFLNLIEEKYDEDLY